MRCEVCGYEAGHDFNFCPQCGSRSYVKCERCGHVNRGSAKFCSNCGVPLPTIIRLLREEKNQGLNSC